MFAFAEIERPYTAKAVVHSIMRARACVHTCLLRPNEDLLTAMTEAVQRGVESGSSPAPVVRIYEPVHAHARAVRENLTPF